MSKTTDWVIETMNNAPLADMCNWDKQLVVLSTTTDSMGHVRWMSIKGAPGTVIVKMEEFPHPSIESGIDTWCDTYGYHNCGRLGFYRDDKAFFLVVRPR